MSIKIKKPEVNEYKIPNGDGAVLIYSPLSSRAIVTEMQKHATLGKFTDQIAFQIALEMMDTCVTGWKGIEDENGTELKFSRDLIEYLPAEIQAQFARDIIIKQWNDFPKALKKDDSKNSKSV